MMEPLYTTRMEDAVRVILDNIPPGDLAIQLDLAREMLALEYERGLLGEEFRPHFAGVEGILAGVLRRIQRFIALIPEDVDLGFTSVTGIPIIGIMLSQRIWESPWVLQTPIGRG
jgi:hypothetical protein